MGRIIYTSIDRRKTWKVTCRGRTISKHIGFWHAQDAISKLYILDKIDNTYRIEPIK